MFFKNKNGYVSYGKCSCRKIIMNEDTFYDNIPFATFQSKEDVKSWCENNNCIIEHYNRTNGNCHVFIINKSE